MANRDVARVATVAVWLSTFANADGTSVKPSQPTIASLTGYSVETVSRCVKILVEAGLLRAQRRPNRTTEYRLTPMMARPDWGALLPLLTDNRHRERHRKAKEERAADAVRAREPEAPPDDPDSVRAGSPDSVRAGVTNSPVTSLDSVRARGRTAGTHGIRIACAPGGTMSHLPPVDTREEHLDTPPLSPQPQVGALLGSAKIDQPDGGWGTTSCPRCGARVVSRPDRTMCIACMREQN